MAALDNVGNAHLPMIRPLNLCEDVIQPNLVQAQEQAQLLFTMINDPDLSNEAIPEITQKLRNSQMEIVVIISEGNAAESVLMQALEINDIVNQVLEDAEHILNGTKRRYQMEIDVDQHIQTEMKKSLTLSVEDVPVKSTTSPADNQNLNSVPLWSNTSIMDSLPNTTQRVSLDVFGSGWDDFKDDDFHYVLFAFYFSNFGNVPFISGLTVLILSSIGCSGGA